MLKMYVSIVRFIASSNLRTIGVVVRMSILDTKVDGSIPSINIFLLEQETSSALLQLIQL